MQVKTEIKKSAINAIALESAMTQACAKIAPLWPLENFVAVNPYMGLSDRKFEEAALELERSGNVNMTLPLSFYLAKVDDGTILPEDIGKVLKKRGIESSANAYINQLKLEKTDDVNIDWVWTVSDVFSKLSSKDWTRFMINRLSTWSASYFDKGQAVWSAANKKQSLFASWKAEALADYTSDVMGLKKFRSAVAKLPDDPFDAAQYSIDRLQIPAPGVETYLYRLLLRLGGWSAHIARIDWDTNLNGGKGELLKEWLAVLICWEACLFESITPKGLGNEWDEALGALGRTDIDDRRLNQKLIMQEAFDAAAQRSIIKKIKEKPGTQGTEKLQKMAQAIFCIDVRSEVFRRNLEEVDPNIETLGFAGFFAFPIKFFPIGRNEGEAQCPVLLKTGPNISEEIKDQHIQKRTVERLRLSHQVRYVWKTFKTGAVTCFGFVSPMGLTYLPKLITDAFGYTRPVADPEHIGMNRASVGIRSVRLTAEDQDGIATGIALNDQVAMAKNALKAMSLTDDFAKFVLIAGHGSTTVNNPYATGLDCGACGGHTGEANAKVAAAVLNNHEVRNMLASENIQIPEGTTFLACLHNTTTDEFTIYNESDVPDSNLGDLAVLKEMLKKAGKRARAERSLRMAISTDSNVDNAVMARSKDWAQVRPEWGLAGCSAFVVASRNRTKGLDLGGKSFLHSYNWKEDTDFSVLELIMTAPMVVTSWISLQYYASTVDNKVYGSGNKTLHNVTAGIGVLEGYAGDLRTGLPIQSVHDGVNFQHEPLRLKVIIEAPIDAINSVLKKHESVRNLCDNGWLFILALNEEGHVSHRYTGNLNWENVE
jgi:uncharacterized protein YbcC (UPF0753/DUF2309 family)